MGQSFRSKAATGMDTDMGGAIAAVAAITMGGTAAIIMAGDIIVIIGGNFHLPGRERLHYVAASFIR
jgi:hypothetical protein